MKELINGMYALSLSGMRLRSIFLSLCLCCSLIPACSQQAMGDKGWGDVGNGFYQNPVLPTDCSDMDCTKVGDDYYAICSTMQFSPGMMVMHSRNLVDWEIIGHAVRDITQITPELDWSKMNRYGRGVWAGAIRYHQGKYYIVFSTADEGIFMTSADRPSGPWSDLICLRREAGWDDPCIIWDEKGKPWMVATYYKDHYKTYLFRLSEDLKSIEPASPLYVQEGNGREASKLLFHEGWYYLFYSEYTPEEGRYVMVRRSRSMDAPFSEVRRLTRNTPGDQEPNQGGIVQGPDHQWYFFLCHGKGGWEGRMASLLPVTWSEGWPRIGDIQEDGIGTMVWKGTMPGKSNPYPMGVQEDFSRNRFSEALEWNYQPRPSYYSLSVRKGWLRMKAFQPLRAGDFLSVGNILTTRVFKTQLNEAVTVIDLSGMRNGMHCGLCHFTKEAGKIGVSKRGGKLYLECLTDNGTKEIPLRPIRKIWLRSTWGKEGRSHFSYSLDGKTFSTIEDAYQLKRGLDRGDRIGLYCYTDSTEGGYADFDYLHYQLR